MSVDGMRNRRSPEKPTTSASTCWPPAIATRQETPVASLMPEASMIRPAMRVRRPVARHGVIRQTASWQSRR